MHDQTALVRAGHDRTAMDGFRILFSLDILWKQYFRVSGAYIALIDEPFVTLKS